MYHDLFTEKSWQILQQLKRQYEFILIGGWAVYLYSHQLKSKDIDIIIEYETLEQLRQAYALQKNDRLKKYEIHLEEIDVDIYVPFFSNLGLPVAEIKAYGQTIEGFVVPKKELLLILKQKAWRDRRGSLKGEKDEVDILSLVAQEIDWKSYRQQINYYQLQTYSNDLIDLLHHRTAVAELGLNAHHYAKLKKSIQQQLTR